MHIARKTKILFGIGIFIILIAAGAGVYLFVFRDQGFQLTGTYPDSNVRIDQRSPTVEFEFSQPVRLPDNFSVDSDPSIDAEVYARDDTVFVIPNHALLQQHEYTISTSRIESQSGESVDGVELTFRTDQNQSPRLNFIRSLPVHNPGYSITYLEDEDTFVVRITEVPIDEKRSRAQNYLQNNGIDTTQNDVKYDVLRSVEDRGAPAG